MKSGKPQTQAGWVALFKANRNVRRAVVFLGKLLQAMQQFTGMNIIMYYAPRIFKWSFLPPRNSK